MADLLPAAARFSIWITPVLLFSLPVELLMRGSEGLWTALLVVVAPLFGFLLATRRTEALPPHPAITCALGLTGSVLLWANLLLAGDVARWLGFSRAAGILVMAASVFVVTASEPGRRWGLALALPALLALFLPLGIVASRAERLPLDAWSYAASLPAFRFSPGSPWVTEGRPVAPRRGIDTLLFEEEHRITTVDAGRLRILVSDLGRVQVQEWTLAANQTVMVRPGDRLVIEPRQRLRFEANKRIPGAPDSGVGWADRPRLLLGPGLLSVVGAGLTLLGGATALLTSERLGPISRATGAVGGIGYLLVLAWGESWATYILSLAPDLFLGGLTPEKLFELPALALRGNRWRPLLGGLLLLGGFFIFLASAAALRGLMARGALEGRDGELWGGMLGVAVLASLWPLDPWRVLLTAFGLGASTLAPLTWIGRPQEHPQAVTVALGAGLSIFLILAVAGQVLPVHRVWAEVVLSYPALVASPVTVVLLWLARRLAG